MVRLASRFAQDGETQGKEALWLADDLHISITRDEVIDAPPRTTAWFKQKHIEFFVLAWEAANRTVYYLRYILKIPNMHEIRYDHDFTSPAWFFDGKLISPNVLILRGPEIPKCGALDEEEFSARHDREFQETIDTFPKPELYEVFLADARTSCINQQVARAVLEAAISIEIFVKGRLLGGAVPASWVVEYLEDKGKLNVRVLDLIDGVARDVLGSSFRIDEPDAYAHIDLLFRARNKVAHRGRPEYKDDSGALHTVDSETLREWWPSIQKLLAWLNGKFNTPTYSMVIRSSATKSGRGRRT